MAKYYQSNFKGSEVDEYLAYVKKLKEEGVSLDGYATKKELEGKQNVIPDLEIIREGARRGKTALQEHQDISHLAERAKLQEVENDNLRQDEDIASLQSSISANSSLIEGNESRLDTLEPKVDGLSEDMDTLKGEGEGSVTAIARAEVAKVVDSAPETMDTLKKIAELIEKDDEQAADILATLGNHEDRIDTLEGMIVVMSEEEYEALPVKEDKLYFCYE